MIYKATKLIKEEMERQGLKYSIEEWFYSFGEIYN